MKSSFPVSSGKANGKVSDNKIKPVRLALIIGGTYIVLAGIYIIFSSQHAAEQAQSVAALELSEMQKGLVFVIVTGMIIIIALAWILHDIATKQRQIIEQRNALLVSERHAVAGMLASSVAHDINNVLTVLTSTVDLLAYGMKDSDPNKKYVDNLGQANQRLVSLTRRLFEVGKTHLSHEQENFYIDNVLMEAVNFSRTHKDVKNCDIDIDCPKNLKTRGFPDLIHQMFFNLILNSAQATNGKGKIRISVRHEKKNIYIDFADNGPGIPPGLREQVFAPFYTTKEGGTGLGMLSIKACVEAHDGKISVGDSVEGGVLFTIYLPISV